MKAGESPCQTVTRKGRRLDQPMRMLPFNQARRGGFYGKAGLGCSRSPGGQGPSAELVFQTAKGLNNRSRGVLGGQDEWIGNGPLVCFPGGRRRAHIWSKANERSTDAGCYDPQNQPGMNRQTASQAVCGFMAGDGPIPSPGGWRGPVGVLISNGLGAGPDRVRVGGQPPND